jgi:hypothetical protein
MTDESNNTLHQLPWRVIHKNMTSQQCALPDDVVLVFDDGVNRIYEPPGRMDAKHAFLLSIPQVVANLVVFRSAYYQPLCFGKTDIDLKKSMKPEVVTADLKRLNEVVVRFRNGIQVKPKRRRACESKAPKQIAKHKKQGVQLEDAAHEFSSSEDESNSTTMSCDTLQEDDINDITDISDISDFEDSVEQQDDDQQNLHFNSSSDTLTSGGSDASNSNDDSSNSSSSSDSDSQEDHNDSDDLDNVSDGLSDSSFMSTNSQDSYSNSFAAKKRS